MGGTPTPAPAPPLDPVRLRAIADEATVIRDAALLLAKRMSELAPHEQAELAGAVLDGYRRLTSRLTAGEIVTNDDRLAEAARTMGLRLSTPD
jgi:hypothetical protein